MDPVTLIHTSSEGAQKELNPDTPFTCVLCGETFNCTDDIVFHLMVEHDYIICNLVDGTHITYLEFLGRISEKMHESIISENDIEC